MSAAERRVETASRGPVERQATLRLAMARRRRLQELFDDPAFIDAALRQGRYLRLCAAIAWASERETRARDALRADELVAMLRAARAGAARPTGPAS